MKIPLNNFENVIDTQILERGMAYFNSRAIKSVEELSPGVYEAIIEGTETYAVTCTVEHGIVTDYDCECPYDQGPVCKHVVALILHLQQDVLDIPSKKSSRTKSKTGTGKKTKASERTTVKKQVNTLLEKIHADDLRKYVLEMALKEPQFRHRFLSDFAYLGETETLEYYGKQVEAILNASRGKYDMIDWDSKNGPEKTIRHLLSTAEKHWQTGNAQSAIYICIAVLESLAGNGRDEYEARRCIEMAYSLLESMSNEALPDELRRELFLYVLNAYRNRVFAETDWHLGMVNLGCLLQANDEEAEELFVLLDKEQSSEYELRRAQEMKFQLLHQVRGKAAAFEYFEAHLDNTEFRKIAIEQAMGDENYDRAIYLANEGIQQDQKQRPGLAVLWYEYLLRIAIAQNNRPEIIRFSIILLLENSRAQQKYYDILKQHVAPDKWPAFVDELVNLINGAYRWYDISNTAWIYINEKQWDKLRAGLIRQFTEQHISLEILDTFAPYLADIYLDDIAEIYRQGILGESRRANKRSHYRRICRHLKKMKAVGAKTQAQELILTLKKMYKKQSAFLDELAGV